MDINIGTTMFTLLNNLQNGRDLHLNRMQLTSKQHETLRYSDFCVSDPIPLKDAELVRILKRALEERRNVIVHCTGGISRSGAVAEVGVMMGFVDAGADREPNMLVKSKMLKHLNWSYE